MPIKPPIHHPLLEVSCNAVIRAGVWGRTFYSRSRLGPQTRSLFMDSITRPSPVPHACNYLVLAVLPSRNLHQQCKQKQVIELQLPGGIISSSLAEVESGRHLCPIIIRAAPGQRVNITLFDFGSAISRGSAGGTGRGLLPGSSVVCQRYALIKEPRSSSPTIVCSGNQRTKGVYLSDGSVVEIQLVHTRHRKEAAHFLLQYSGW